MLDGNGCHKCQNLCEKFGVPKSEYHCHIFSPESVQAYKRASAGATANAEAMLASNILLASEYISLKGDKTGLLIGPIKKEIAGKYNIVNQSCGFGTKQVTITEGTSQKIKKVFGVNVNPSTPGLFTIDLLGRDYLTIGTANSRLSVIDDQDEIVCSGQSIKEHLYLFCRSSLSPEKRAGVTGICRTSLVRTR